MNFRVVVETAPFDSATEIGRLRQASSQVGGIVCFIGVVRDINDSADVAGLYLEHYPGMTEKQITAIMMEAAERWPLIDATVIHRVGQLVPSDEIVFVGVASQHRGDAFDACEFIIDYLKTRATFWKKETTPAGDRWLVTRQSDIDAAGVYAPDEAQD